MEARATLEVEEMDNGDAVQGRERMQAKESNRLDVGLLDESA